MGKTTGGVDGMAVLGYCPENILLFFLRRRLTTKKRPAWFNLLRSVVIVIDKSILIRNGEEIEIEIYYGMTLIKFTAARPDMTSVEFLFGP